MRTAKDSRYSVKKDDVHRNQLMVLRVIGKNCRLTRTRKKYRYSAAPE